jgi:hypothetical protein
MVVHPAGEAQPSTTSRPEGNARYHPRVRHVRAIAIGLTAAVVLLGARPSAAQLFPAPGADRFFRVEWEVKFNPARGAVISGYVYNSNGVAANNVRLLIEAVDESGEVVATTLGYVLGQIPSNDRRYFQEAVPRTVSTYRVRVVLYEWVDRGGGS